MRVKLFIILLIIFSSTFVSAITARIGNPRMVLSAEVGDTIDKYVLVKNVNNEAVNISLFVSGNLSKDVKLKEKSFILQAGEEKKAYFSIKAKEAGRYETKITVQFLPLDKGNSAGMISTIILNVYGKGELPKEDEEENDEEAGNEKESNNSKITGAFIGSKKNILPVAMLLITTIILIILLLFILNKKIKKRSGRRV